MKFIKATTRIGRNKCYIRADKIQLIVESSDSGCAIWTDEFTDFQVVESAEYIVELLTEE